MTTADRHREAGGSHDRSPGGRWLIDGNNVMGSRPDGWWRDRAAGRARLTAQIADWGSRTRPIVLVFDGRADDAVLAMADPGLELRFARSGAPDAADDLIVELATAGDTVVTADRGLLARLPAGVAVIGPRQLLEAMECDRALERPTN